MLESDTIIPGWIISRQPDGTLLIREKLYGVRRSAKGCLAFGCLWNSTVWLPIAIELYWLPAPFSFRNTLIHTPEVLLPFALVGALLVLNPLVARYRREQWIAAPNRLELQWGWTFSRKLKSSAYVDGTLTIDSRDDSRLGPDQVLTFACSGGWMKQGVLTQTRGTGLTPKHLRTLAELLAQTTGWPLTTARNGEPDPNPPETS